MAGFRRRLTSASAEVKARRTGRSQNPAEPAATVGRNRGASVLPGMAEGCMGALPLGGRDGERAGLSADGQASVRALDDAPLPRPYPGTYPRFRAKRQLRHAAVVSPRGRGEIPRSPDHGVQAAGSVRHACSTRLELASRSWLGSHVIPCSQHRQGVFRDSTWPGQGACCRKFLHPDARLDMRLQRNQWVKEVAHFMHCCRYGLSIGISAPDESRGCRSDFRPSSRAEARPTVRWPSQAVTH